MNFDKIIKLSKDDLKIKVEKELRAKGYNPVNEDGFLYAEGTFPVLLCAHMDTVHKTPVKNLCKSDTGVWMSPEGIGGDDRCGVYMILQIIRHYNCSVLFTEDEEIGCIGAGKFVASGIKPDINYIIEFDRKGKQDCVFYQCDNPEFTEYIEKAGFVTASGSCSDISKIAPALGKAAVNLSCGYYNPHSTNEYIVLNDMWDTVRKVEQLFDKPLKSFEFIQKVYSYDSYYGGAHKYDMNAWYREHPEYDYRDKEWDADKRCWVEKKNKSVTKSTKKIYDCHDKEVQDIIWLWAYYADDEAYIMHDKNSKFGELVSVMNYGVDERGDFWYMSPATNGIEKDERARLYDSLGYQVFPMTIYHMLEAKGYKEIATFAQMDDDEKEFYTYNGGAK